jgi:two-component system nitrogen regulation sensor histidine kinase NtrY
MADLLQEQCLLDQIVRVFGPEHRLGEAREAGEFIDHLPEVADLADDGAGKLVEQFAVLLDLLAVTPLQALSGELDRGQRILDFVRDAAGDVGPRGLPLADISQQLAGLVASDLSSGIIQYAKGGELLTLAVKVSSDTRGPVITFEDITRQLLDQRQAAWSDVARRIAHEIRNPLTPIQLATERLNRRYAKQIENDRPLFEELTATIIRQVGDLRKMVDEFSSFARLPKPVFRAEDPVALARQSLFLQEVSRPDIDFRFSAAEGITTIACDRHQFGQAMTNVLKNAVEAIEARAKAENADYRGLIAVTMARGDRDNVVVSIADNGIGLPQDGERIIEPYVTTREKGTGLGLAIVNKIVEEHGGEMSFGPGEGGSGTSVSMSFACDPLALGRGSEAAE